MIKNFLIINCTGENDSIGLKVNNNFFIKEFQNTFNNNETLTESIVNFTRKNNAIIDDKFSILINQGPGSFSTIRIALAIAKGINISKGAKLFGYRSDQLAAFNLENIELLIQENNLENKLIKPIYIS